MPAYHSAFLAGGCYQVIGNYGLLPLRRVTKGNPKGAPIPAPMPDENNELYDIADEAIELYRANTLFRNFETKGPADIALIYSTMFIQQILACIKPTANLNDARKEANSIALEWNFPIPGEPGFPLNSFFERPANELDAQALRNYLFILRQELAIRILDIVYSWGAIVPSKWWLSFSKRKFIGRSF